MLWVGSSSLLAVLVLTFLTIGEQPQAFGNPKTTNDLVDDRKDVAISKLIKWPCDFLPPLCVWRYKLQEAACQG